MNRLFPLLGLLTFLPGPMARSAQVVTSAPAVTQPPLSAELRPEKSAFLLGEPIVLSFVARNESEVERTVISGGDFWNRHNFKIEVRDEAGDLVPQLAQPGLHFYSGLFGGRKFPAQGELTYSLFLPHWAKFSKAGRYRITAKRSLAFLSPGKTIFSAFDKPPGYVSVPVEASADVEVLPRDDAEMGALINRLGAILLSSQGTGSYENETKLSAIHDPRVVPFLIREAEQADPHNFALSALSQYDDDAAFGVLKKLATGSRPKDARIYEAGLLPSDPEQLRLKAARHIAWGKHPRRTEFLVSLRHDPMAEIRVIVVQNLGGLPVERARAIWTEMLGDSNEEVRREAKRHLEQSQAKK